MASIEFDARLQPEVEEKYTLWMRDQPRGPGQIGGAIYTDVKGGPYANGMVFRQFPDAFVDELERSGTAITRK